MMALVVLLLTKLGTASIRTKREELRKLQKKLARAKHHGAASKMDSILELEGKVAALRHEIDGTAPKVSTTQDAEEHVKQEPVPVPVSERPERRGPENVPHHPGDEPSTSIRKYITMWRNGAKDAAKSRVGRLTTRLESWFSSHPQCVKENRALHAAAARISRLENQLITIAEDINRKIQNESDVEKVRVLSEQRKREQQPIFGELEKERGELEHRLLASC